MSAQSAEMEHEVYQASSQWYPHNPLGSGRATQEQRSLRAELRNLGESHANLVTASHGQRANRASVRMLNLTDIRTAHPGPLHPARIARTSSQISKFRRLWGTPQTPEEADLDPVRLVQGYFTNRVFGPSSGHTPARSSDRNTLVVPS